MEISLDFCSQHGTIDVNISLHPPFSLKNEVPVLEDYNYCSPNTQCVPKYVSTNSDGTAAPYAGFFCFKSQCLYSQNFVKQNQNALKT